MDILHIKWLLYYQRYLLSALELNARYEWWVMAPEMHCNLFLISHLCVLTRITWNFRSYVNVQHIKRLLYYRRHFLYSLELHERSDWRAMFPDMYQSFSDTTLCTYNASAYIHCYLVHKYAWQQNLHTLWLHTAHQAMALLPPMHCFIRTKLASHTTHCSVLVKLLVFYELAAKQKKQTKGQNFSVKIKYK